MELELRPAAYEEPDARALTVEVQAYYRELHGGIDDSPLGKGELSPPNGAFLLGYLSGGAVAMGGWRFLPGLHVLDGRRVAELRRMYVSPALRRRGAARQLLAALEAGARGAGVDVMVLATGQPQVAAVRFYRACGYLDVPGFGHYASAAEAIHLARRLVSREVGSREAAAVDRG